MNENEYRFAKNIVNLEKNITEALEYIHENFNVDAEYDEEENKIKIKSKSINEGLEVSLIKEYIEKTFDGYITIDA
jgi:hypothetical protein